MQLEQLTQNFSNSQVAITTIENKLANLASAPQNNSTPSIVQIEPITAYSIVIADTLTPDLVTAVGPVDYIPYDTIDNTVSAASSGDFIDTSRAWVRGAVANAKQNQISGIAEYKVNQYGFSIGADIGTDRLIGIAYTFMHDKVSSRHMVNKSDLPILAAFMVFGYDLGLSKEYHSNSGYLQVRVDF